MHQQTIQSIVEEVRSRLTGNFLGKIFQLTPMSLVLDLGFRNSFLAVSVEPSSPRFYLTRRRVKDLEKQSIQLSHFGQSMKSLLGGGRLLCIEKDRGERIVRLLFRVEDELGTNNYRRLVAQLTGRSANIFVLDELNRIVAALRSPKGRGQMPGDFYLPPPPTDLNPRDPLIDFRDSPSQAVEDYFAANDARQQFELLVSNVLGQTRKALSQKKKLKDNLQRDLALHGNPEEHKRLGDLLLANISTAKRENGKVKIQNFYEPDTPIIEVEIDENTSVQEAANQSFRRYTKAKKAAEEIQNRMLSLDVEVRTLEQRQQELERIAMEGDVESLNRLVPTSAKSKPHPKKVVQEQKMPGVRRYVSSDGFEILVGRGAKDNDNLTFRIARPADLWLHAGDYPGSHVVVRNPNRKEIPQRTIIEAAQLAGKFSQASEDAKVVIHYTEKKFLSKPKGAAPGLVRMSSFKSITVEPKEVVKRL